MQKIDDFLSKDAIDEVPNRASENQTKRERRKPIPGGEFSIERNDDPDCDQRYGYEESEAVNLRSVRKQTECRTGVSNMGKVKEPRDDGDLVRVAEMRVDRDFGGEIENQNAEKCSDCDAELRRHETRHAITALPSGLSPLTRIEAIAIHSRRDRAAHVHRGHRNSLTSGLSQLTHVGVIATHSRRGYRNSLASGLSQLTRVEPTIAPHRGRKPTRLC